MAHVNLYSLAQAGYTQPKEHYSKPDLECLSTRRLRDLACQKLSLRARLVRGKYEVTDIRRNVIVDFLNGTDETLREFLVDKLSCHLSS